MNLSKELFQSYFGNNITQNELYKNIGFDSIDFEQFLMNAMLRAVEQEDAEMLEYLIFTMYLGDDAININTYLDILNRLILCKWHKQHEDISLLLQRINSPKSIDYLYKAIFLQLDYLDWDDNYAFEKKCVHAIAKCNNQEALNKLRILASNDNEILKQCAEKQIKKMQNNN